MDNGRGACDNYFMNNTATVTIRTTNSGRKWIRIEARMKAEAFGVEIRRIADAHGVDRSAPGCRVLSKSGKKVWQVFGERVHASFDNFAQYGSLVAGYYLPEAA